MKQKYQPLTASKRYVTFKNQSYDVLDVIFTKYSDAIARVTERMNEHTLTICKAHYPDIDRIKKEISTDYHLRIIQYQGLIEKLRRTTYTFAVASESEALSRAHGTNHPTKITDQMIMQHMFRHTPSGGALRDRLHLMLNKLAYKVFSSVELSRTLELSGDEMIEGVKKVLPKGAAFDPSKIFKKRVPKVKMTEAAGDAIQGTRQKYLSTGIISQDVWNDVVSDYTDKELPFGRTPQDKTIYYDIADGERSYQVKYDWELEKEVTEDFVRQLRSGEIQAAKTNGYDDFMWVAVLDGKTDECCEWRDGLTSSEIESELKDHGDDDGDACNGAIVPPGHFNCRCRPAPMSKDLPEETPLDLGSVQDWLDSRPSNG